MVIYDGGTSINTWSHFSINPLNQLKGLNYRAGTFAQIKVSLTNRKSQFSLGPSLEKQTVIQDFDLKLLPNKDLYPCIGFYGCGEIECL